MNYIKETSCNYLSEIPYVLRLVYQFHEKFGIGIGTRSQQEMFFRNNLLFEELTELSSAIEDLSNIEEELADVYYVLVGNIVTMGYDYIPQIKTNSNFSHDAGFQDLLVQCGHIAKTVRKKWSPDDPYFIEQFLDLHLSAIGALYRISGKLGITNVLEAIVEKHETNMNRKSKRVGEVEVVSSW